MYIFERERESEREREREKSVITRERERSAHVHPAIVHANTYTIEQTQSSFARENTRTHSLTCSPTHTSEHALAHRNARTHTSEKQTYSDANIHTLPHAYF